MCMFPWGLMHHSTEVEHGRVFTVESRVRDIYRLFQFISSFLGCLDRPELVIYLRNLLASPISPPGPPVPPNPLPSPFMYIFSAISAAWFTADCLSPD